MNYQIQSEDGYSFKVIRNFEGGWNVEQRDNGVCINVWKENDFEAARELAKQLAK